MSRSIRNEQDDEQVSPEVRERAVRMVSEHRADYRSEWDAMVSIAEDRVHGGEARVQMRHALQHVVAASVVAVMSKSRRPR